MITYLSTLEEKQQYKWFIWSDNADCSKSRKKVTLCILQSVWNRGETFAGHNIHKCLKENMGLFPQPQQKSALTCYLQVFGARIKDTSHLENLCMAAPDLLDPNSLGAPFMAPLPTEHGSQLLLMTPYLIFIWNISDVICFLVARASEWKPVIFNVVQASFLYFYLDWMLQPLWLWRVTFPMSNWNIV